MTADRVAPESEIFFALCKSVDTPFSLGLWLRYKYGEHADLASVDIDPRNYRGPASFRHDYLVVSFLSKWKGLQTGYDLREQALRRFEDAEVNCASTNQWIKLARDLGFDPDTESVMSTARRKISGLLGPFEWEKVRRGGWGPGATFDLKRRAALPDSKMSELPFTVTRRCLPHFQRCLRADLHWSAVVLGVQPSDIGGEFCFLSDSFQVIEGCRIETVPKNAKTDRVIAVEPRANAFLQKGAGSYIRSRLRTVGIDLSDQSANQRGAQRAIVDSLATIDLKAASDTVSLELVYELLPVDWAIALDELRSPYYEVDGEWKRFEKFSSMGNGFTFELETLIFWALATACVSDGLRRQEVLVYGDDIVVPSECSARLLDVLQLCGFEINTSKTFTKGVFYESCGKHFYEGEEVTPIYQKEVCQDNDLSIVRCGNRIIRYSLRYADRLTGKLSSVGKSAWQAARRRGYLTQALQIPLGMQGDDGWALPRSEFHDNVPYDENRGYRCRVLAPVFDTLPAFEPALLALSLRIREDAMTSTPVMDWFREIPFREAISKRIREIVYAERFPFWMGDIPVEREKTRLSRRWIIPTEEFGYAW